MDKENKKYNPKVTKEDLDTLGNPQHAMDTGDDQILKNRIKPVDFTGKDLDVPGRTLPKNRDKTVFKDEENSLYGQGGERNENLEKTTRNKLDSNSDGNG